MTSQTDTIAIIDCDSLVYRAGFACQRKIYTIHMEGRQPLPFQYKKEAKAWLVENNLSEEDVLLEVTETLEPVEHAIRIINSCMQSMLDDLNTDNWIAYLTPTDGVARDSLGYTAKYKGNRDGMVKPVHYDKLRSLLINKWHARIEPLTEADDICCVLAYTYFLVEPSELCPAILCHIDKDLDMVPGWHYNFVKKEQYWIDELEADRHFYKQMLTGDNSDNIIGLAGVGNKTADKLLSHCTTWEEMDGVVRGEYEKEFGDQGEARFRENQALLWMCRTEQELEALKEEHLHASN